MKRSPIFSISLIVILSLFSTGYIKPAAGALDSPQTYTVLVGAEDVSHASSVMAFFPATLHVHVNDTVQWNQITHEIHTVTFLVGADEPPLIVPAPDPFPPGTLMLNPQVAFPTAPQDGLYDGTTFANSGIMSTDPGNPTQFSLTFTQEGTFEYMCLIHGMMMSGTIIVDPPSTDIPSPARVLAQARLAIKQELAHANALFGEAMAAVPAPQQNPDGTTNYTVLIGWEKGQVDLMDFFPGKLTVHPGDTVQFILSPTNIAAPHTVTFLNGFPDIELIIPVPNPPGPPFLLINPEVIFPINPGEPLTREKVLSSGLLDPLGPGPKSFTWTIGDISGEIAYECLLHDTSGMEATLKVVP